jgi:hypothetical protein
MSGLEPERRDAHPLAGAHPRQHGHLSRHHHVHQQELRRAGNLWGLSGEAFGLSIQHLMIRLAPAP